MKAKQFLENGEWAIIIKPAPPTESSNHKQISTVQFHSSSPCTHHMLQQATIQSSPFHKENQTPVNKIIYNTNYINYYRQ